MQQLYFCACELTGRGQEIDVSGSGGNNCFTGGEATEQNIVQSSRWILTKPSRRVALRVAIYQQNARAESAKVST
jgi:hypothetical protein